MTETFVKERPLQAASVGRRRFDRQSQPTEMGEVTVDDATAFHGALSKRRDGRFRGDAFRARSPQLQYV